MSGRGRQGAQRLLVRRRGLDVLADAVRAWVDPREVDVGVDASEDGAERGEHDEHEKTSGDHAAVPLLLFRRQDALSQIRDAPLLRLGSNWIISASDSSEYGITIVSIAVYSSSVYSGTFSL